MGGTWEGEREGRETKRKRIGRREEKKMKTGKKEKRRKDERRILTQTSQRMF